jgi:hypothetical protein
MSKAVLAPAAVLVLWSLVVMGWLAVSRSGALKQVPREKLRELPRTGARGQDLEKVTPPEANWVAHNHTHLMEQPTLFYATVAILAIAGAATQTDVWLAWGYTVLRVAHSLWQILVNRIPVRFALFAASSACLVILAINALRATLG